MIFGSWNRVVGVVTRLRAGQTAVRIPAGKRGFSLLQNVHIGSGGHPASYSLCAMVIFVDIERPEREVEHSPLSGAEVRNKWSHTIPHICVHDVDGKSLPSIFIQ